MGQRLDGTGLYYYNARYYDPTIGRFISPDTMIPNPANPQCFNRYSYCLNNPLKYTDPSGNYLVINGIGDTEIGSAINSGQYGQLLMYSMDKQRKAWNSMRNISTSNALWCHTIETSTEHTLYINTADLGNRIATKSEKQGNDYTITMTNNDFVAGKTYEQGEALAWEITESVLVTTPDFNNYENYSNLIGLLPIGGFGTISEKVDTILNSWQAFWGTADNLQGNQGQIDWGNLIIDGLLTAGTFYPPTAPLCASALFVKGGMEQQRSFDALMVAYGGYEFK